MENHYSHSTISDMPSHIRLAVIGAVTDTC